MKNKPEKLQQYRRVVQTAIFLFIVAVFVTYQLYLMDIINFKIAGINSFSPFSGYETLYSFLTQGDDMPHIKSFSLVLAIVILGAPFVAGRFFCGWICPFGTLHDYISRIKKRLIKDKYQIKPKLDSKLGWIKFGVLALIIITKGFYGSCFLTHVDPWTAFSNLPGITRNFAEIPLAYIALLVVFAGAFFIPRFFCRYFCPLGALQALPAGLGLTGIKKTGGNCSGCGMCSGQCPVGISLDTQDQISSPECINCLKCLELKCGGERPVFQLSLGKYRLKPLAYVIISVFFFTLAVTLAWQAVSRPDPQMLIEGKSLVHQREYPGTSYRDGIYYGSARGFAPGLEVKVKIKKGRINDIVIMKHHETSGYYEESFALLPRRIIEMQSTEIDLISGATYTGNGIRDAVENALAKALP
jgi:NosR/NirI family nitrous oxide reductase transcriptional regulator